MAETYEDRDRVDRARTRMSEYFKASRIGEETGDAREGTSRQGNDPRQVEQDMVA